MAEPGLLVKARHPRKDTVSNFSFLAITNILEALKDRWACGRQGKPRQSHSQHTVEREANIE